MMFVFNLMRYAPSLEFQTKNILESPSLALISESVILNTSDWTSGFFLYCHVYISCVTTKANISNEKKRRNEKDNKNRRWWNRREGKNIKMKNDDVQNEEKKRGTFTGRCSFPIQLTRAEWNFLDASDDCNLHVFLRRINQSKPAWKISNHFCLYSFLLVHFFRGKKERGKERKEERWSSISFPDSISDFLIIIKKWFRIFFSLLIQSDGIDWMRGEFSPSSSNIKSFWKFLKCSQTKSIEPRAKITFNFFSCIFSSYPSAWFLLLFSPDYGRHIHKGWFL